MPWCFTKNAQVVLLRIIVDGFFFIKITLCKASFMPFVLFCIICIIMLSNYLIVHSISKYTYLLHISFGSSLNWLGKWCYMRFNYNSRSIGWGFMEHFLLQFEKNRINNNTGSMRTYRNSLKWRAYFLKVGYYFLRQSKIEVKA